jgi:hypothetical protein
VTIKFDEESSEHWKELAEKDGSDQARELATYLDLVVTRTLLKVVVVADDGAESSHTIVA